MTTVADLAHEAAKRYCDAVPLRDWVVALLDRLGLPATAPARAPVHVDALAGAWRRVLEEQMVEHFTIPELRVLARFFDTPESVSVMRKLPAWTATVQPMLEAEIAAWIRAQLKPPAGEAGGDPAQHPIQ